MKFTFEFNDYDIINHMSSTLGESKLLTLEDLSNYYISNGYTPEYTLNRFINMLDIRNNSEMGNLVVKNAFKNSCPLNKDAHVINEIILLGNECLTVTNSQLYLNYYKKDIVKNNKYRESIANYIKGVSDNSIKIDKKDIERLSNLILTFNIEEGIGVFKQIMYYTDRTLFENERSFYKIASIILNKDTDRTDLEEIFIRYYIKLLSSLISYHNLRYLRDLRRVFDWSTYTEFSKFLFNDSELIKNEFIKQYEQEKDATSRHVLSDRDLDNAKTFLSKFNKYYVEKFI